MCCMQEVRWKGHGARFVSSLLGDEGLNCNGQEMIQDLEGLEFW